MLIDDQIVATYDLQQTQQALRHETSSGIKANQVTVRFLNDHYEPIG
ncbi:hypothetical protein [Stieleria varia]